ncbi:MAG: hypothetical protein EBZ77_05285, partial [Chitinophagia bacterium]|nr:hypothetical protein [Chitinophagia bacterium]
MDISTYDLTGYSSTSIADHSGCSGSGYTDRTGRDSCQMQQAGTYTANIACSGYYSLNTQAWIDFNNNNTFESSETVGGANSYSYSTSYSISIPRSAATGRHKMRILVVQDYSGRYPSIDPCGGYYYGDSRDYIVNIIALPACSSAPTAGTTVSSTGTACPSRRFTLSLSGTSLVSGLGYQWQSSSDSSTWTNITGATSITYTTTISARTYFRCVVTCTSASASANSIPVRVNYISVCYCIPSFYYATSACSIGMDIYTFSTTGYSGSSLSDAGVPCDGTGYMDRSGLTVNMQQSRTYVANISPTSSSYTMSAQAWIDFNDDGTFASSESVGGITSYTGSASFNMLIPTTATPGAHMMRVANVYYYSSRYPSIDPCTTTDTYGEIRDYTVNVIALPPCTGTPTAGNIVPSTAFACPSYRFTLTDTGFSVASAIAFQWQISTDSSSWSNITGATSYAYSGTTSAVRYYRVIVKCTATGDSAFTPGYRMGYLSSCYCIPSFTYASTACYSYGMDISSFSVAGYSSSLTDRAGCDGTGYLDRTTLSVSMMQSVNYLATLTSTSSSYRMNAQVWIDFNDNRTFETSESVGGINNYVSTANFYLNIPITAATGTHRMRVMATYYSGGSYPSLDPCTTYYSYGEARDYMVNIVPLPPCSGVPSAGYVLAQPFTACYGRSFRLVDTAYSMASGLTFRWQSSSDSTTWTTISGATDYYYSTTETATTYFRAIVTCTSTGGGIDTTYAYRQDYIDTCYCIPSYVYTSGCSIGMNISSYNVDGYSGSTLRDAASCDGSNYLDRTGLVVNMQQAGSYSSTISESSSYTLNVQAWIDFNNNGRFEPTEIVGGYNSYYYSTTFNINIPIAARTGYHRMRVRMVYAYSTTATYPSIDPCYSGYSYGETRDYTVNIVPLPPCTGRPSPGYVLSSVAYACPSTTFYLTDTAFTVTGRLGFQWQQSSDSSTWTNIAGATDYNYGAIITDTTFFRCIVKCLATGDSAFTPGRRVDYAHVCYCTPRQTYPAGCTSYGMGINSFNVVGYSGSISDAASCDGSGYLDRTTASFSCSMMQSLSYTATITATGYYTLSVQTWIDLNDNGTFESAEMVGGLASYVSSGTYSINIPLAAPSGVHRMRVREVYASYGSYPSIDPCNIYTYSEARDYNVTIVPLPPCSGAPTAGTVSASTAITCPSRPFTLTDAGFTVAGSLVFQWQKSSDSVSWTDISGATSTYLTTTTVGVTYYRVKLTCTPSGLTDSTAGIRIDYDSVCYCLPAFYYPGNACSYGMSIGRFDVVGESGTAINDRSACDGSGYRDRTTLSATLMQSLTYNATMVAGSSTYNLSTQTWIDFNNDGTFASSETVGGVTPYSGSTLYSISIPLTAPTGRH